MRKRAPATRARAPGARRCARAAGSSLGPRYAFMRPKAVQNALAVALGVRQASGMVACSSHPERCALLLGTAATSPRPATLTARPAAQPTDWTIKMNKKEKRLAMATALQSAAGSITVVDDVQARARPFVAGKPQRVRVPVGGAAGARSCWCRVPCYS